MDDETPKSRRRLWPVVAAALAGAASSDGGSDHEQTQTPTFVREHEEDGNDDCPIGWTGGVGSAPPA